MKAVPTVVLLGSWLIFRAARGQRVFPTPRILGVLLCSALFMQFAGNVLFQWTLGILGIVPGSMCVLFKRACAVSYEVVAMVHE